MNKKDRQYYIERAEQELGRAQNSDCPKVVRAHFEMANSYLDRAYGDSSAEVSESRKMAAK